jgi:hypothetical protein
MNWAEILRYSKSAAGAIIPFVNDLVNKGKCRFDPWGKV